jgi:hypothetical protein
MPRISEITDAAGRLPGETAAQVLILFFEVWDRAAVVGSKNRKAGEGRSRAEAAPTTCFVRRRSGGHGSRGSSKWPRRDSPKKTRSRRAVQTPRASSNARGMARSRCSRPAGELSGEARRSSCRHHGRGRHGRGPHVGTQPDPAQTGRSWGRRPNRPSPRVR